LSESQERMVLVCEPAKFDQLAKVFERWGLDAAKIGEVTAKKTVELHWKGELLADIDPDILVENAPQYQRPYKVLPPMNRVTSRTWAKARKNGAQAGVCLDLCFKDIRGTSRKFITRQYDSRVGASTARDTSDSVGVVRLKDSKRALGVVLGCRPHLMRLDARVGGLDAVAYPAFEMALKGFETLAVTDCLNFGNPEKENVMSDFVAALDGMNSVCAALEAPIISGNVSFYNETMGKNISPTPSTGLVGLRPDLNNLPQSFFTKIGQLVYVLRLPGFVTGGTDQESWDTKSEAIGELDGRIVGDFIRTARVLSGAPGVEATRAIGKFGLAYALGRMTIENGIGAVIDTEGLKMIRPDLDETALFEEHLYEALIIVDASRATDFEDAFTAMRQASPTSELHRVGRTINSSLEIGAFIKVEAESLKESYSNGWSAHFESLA
jgi:phosphoribosylformylglycinamidine (FGAM) synthase-like enzyme